MPADSAAASAPGAGVVEVGVSPGAPLITSSEGLGTAAEVTSVSSAVVVAVSGSTSVWIEVTSTFSEVSSLPVVTELPVVSQVHVTVVVVEAGDAEYEVKTVSVGE